MAKSAKNERWSVETAGTVAAIAFVVAFIVLYWLSTIGLYKLTIAVTRAGASISYRKDVILVAVAIALPGIAAYCVSRIIFRIMRWKNARPNHCNTCDYNLTGNVSGICPECGEPI